jgi:hypothetical protein
MFLGIFGDRKVLKHRTDFSPWPLFTKKVLVTTENYFIGHQSFSITKSKITKSPKI